MALAGEHMDLLGEESDPPSNLSSAGQRTVLAKVRSTMPGATSTRFWMWLAADNLKLHAANAVACAAELRRLRPRGKVQ
jgi:aspartate-semialdehyde dehydrogenase